MTATEEFIDFLDAKLHELYPRVAANNEALTKIAGKIESYVSKLDKAPPLEMCSRWAAELETKLQAEAYVQEQTEPTLEPEPPAENIRQWTDAELDAMSSEDMVRHGLVSRNIRTDERQGSSGVEYRPERAGTRKVRTVKFSDEQLQAEAYRRRVLEADKADRKRVTQDLRKAMENARKATK